MAFQPSRLVIFVQDVAENGPCGPILYAEEPIASELLQWNGIGDISEYDFEKTLNQVLKRPEAIPKGLVVWEGWIEWGYGEEPDGVLAGDWRKLTHWEMCKIREGIAPWEDPRERGISTEE